MDTNGGYANSQMPLAGAVLCCTSIPPEKRAQLAAIGAQMGAVSKLDLTSDVTHLIVGNRDSEKYRYVARSRNDVKVLLPDWLEAVRKIWMEGGDVDIVALEQQYKIPIFQNFKISITGFDNPDYRKYIQDTVTQHGAEYHGDLTKNVITHLIAAGPSGKKYEHAMSWGIHVVSREWFDDCLQRGLLLEEKYYDPRLSKEEQGKGAWERRQSVSPILGKRTRGLEGPRPQSLDANPHRRKLRRSASNKLCSQSESLWAGITAMVEKKPNETDDWSDSFIQPNHPASSATQASEGAVVLHDSKQPAETDPAYPPRRPLALPSNGNDGIFESRVVYVQGFDDEKTRILQQHLTSNGATLIRTAAEFDTLSSDHIAQGFVVMPHDAALDVSSLPDAAGPMTIATEWWVERCLHGKVIVNPVDDILSRPFEKRSIEGMLKGMIINSTSFTGIELLHISKVIDITGAEYDGWLRPTTSVIICNARKISKEKLKFATDKHIPAVGAEWLYESLRLGKKQPYVNFLLKEVPEKSHIEVPTEPLTQQNNTKLRERRAQSYKPQPTEHVAKEHRQDRKTFARTGILELALSAEPGPAATGNASKTNLCTTDNLSSHKSSSSSLLEQRDDAFVLDGAASTPLQEISSNSSPLRPASTRPTSPGKLGRGRQPPPEFARPNKSSQSVRKVTTEPANVTRPREPTPDSVIPPPSDHQPPPSPKPDPAILMSSLLARQKAVAAAKKETEQDQKKRRRRQLGRATSTTSNPSTAGSIPSFAPNCDFEEVATEAGAGLELDVGDGRDEFQASQELGWEAPDVAKKRESMIRRMGGKVGNGGGVVKAVGGVVRDAGDSIEGVMGRGRRKREKGF